MYNKSIVTALACGASMLLLQPLTYAQSSTPESTPSAAPSATPSTSAEASPAWPGMMHGHGDPLEHLTRELNLTDDQKAKIKPILDQNMPQIKAIHEDAVAKMKAVMDTMHAQIKPILTPEQQQKLDQMQQHMSEMHGKMHGWGGPGEGGPGKHHGPGGPGEMHKGGGWLIEQLGLTADQQAKVKAIFEASRPQMQAIHQDTTLSAADKHAKMQALRDANNAQIRALLTPDQQQKFDTLLAERKAKHGEPESTPQPTPKQ